MQPLLCLCSRVVRLATASNDTLDLIVFAGPLRPSSSCAALLLCISGPGLLRLETCSFQRIAVAAFVACAGRIAAVASRCLLFMAWI